MLLSDFPYGIVTALRNLLYDRGWLPKYQSSLPVICIGNLSVGGNGKTPLVLYVLTALKQHGKRPVTLSRGYGGSSSGPHLVADSDKASFVGDEPLMLHRKTAGPVVIARKRVAGAKFIEEQSLGDVIILDDGFQHRALARDIDLICVYVGSNKALSAFQKGRLIPFGRFRESKIRGLSRAQAVIFNSRSTMPLLEKTLQDLKRDLPTHLEIFTSYLQLDEISTKDGMSLLKGQPAGVDAFCGLAQPEVFFSSLESFGLKIQKSYVFKDHHEYSEPEISKILSQSEGRPVVCSEKDAVKLEGIDVRSIFVAKTSLIVEPQKRFLEFILKVV